MPDRHGAPLPLPDPDSLPTEYLEDPELYFGLTTDMSTYLVMERALEGRDDGE